MFNKHFMKTIILFASIILVGLVGVLITNSFDNSEDSQANVIRAQARCALVDC